MNCPYEILIRANAQGEYQGAHVIETAGGLPRGVKEGDFPEIAIAINAATLARLDELEAELRAVKEEAEAFKESARTAAQTAKSVIENPAIDDTRTIATVAEIVRQVLQPVADRELEEAERKVAEAMALVEKLKGNK